RRGDRRGLVAGGVDPPPPRRVRPARRAAGPAGQGVVVGRAARRAARAVPQPARRAGRARIPRGGGGGRRGGPQRGRPPPARRPGQLSWHLPADGGRSAGQLGGHHPFVARQGASAAGPVASADVGSSWWSTSTLPCRRRTKGAAASAPRTST